MRTIKLALIGLGTVGSGVVKILREHAEHLRSQSGVDFSIGWVVVRDPNKTRSVTVPGARIVTDIGPVVNDPEVEIAVELMGTVQPAREIIRKLLASGKHVVTANKAVLAEHGRELFSLANEKDRSISFEASVAGGIPIIAAVSQSLAANRITSVAGILNGTSNYILSAMHLRGLGYGAALKQAQEKGFAESDPTLDVNGMDAAQKLAILARLAFQSTVAPTDVRCRGIDTLSDMDIRFATELGYVIKLLAIAQQIGERLYLRVAPTLVPKNHPLGQVHGEYNAVRVVGHAAGDTMYFGKGAGMMPTASSVVANLLDLAIGRGQETFRSLRLWEENPPGPPVARDAYMKSRFYLRYTICDQPGTLARIAGILGKFGISIASVIQHETSEAMVGSAVPLIIMTHMADEGGVWSALAETDSLDIVRQPTVCLHVAD